MLDLQCSRKNKRYKASVNGDKKSLNMYPPAYSLANGGKEDDDYGVPRNRTDSIDSMDLQLHHKDSKLVRGINNPLPSTPPLPPAYDHKNLYCSGNEPG